MRYLLRRETGKRMNIIGLTGECIADKMEMAEEEYGAALADAEGVA